MIRATRRSVMAGALAVPTLSGLAAWRLRHGEGRVLLHDPSLEAGRRLAAAGKIQGLPSRAITGDRVRFMRAVLESRPSLIAGVSRHGDLLLLADIAAEAGYVVAAELEGRGRSCSGAACLPGWNALGRLGRSSGSSWIEALAAYAADPRGGVLRQQPVLPALPDMGLVLGWVLVPRG